MRYFEKVFDGQVLKWCVNGAELGGGKSTLLCLVSNETEAESCLSKLEPHCGEAQATALILPGGILPETAVQSLVFEWQTTGIIDKCKLSLTASQSCADAAWRLISHLSHCFSAAAILRGCLRWARYRTFKRLSICWICSLNLLRLASVRQRKLVPTASLDALPLGPCKRLIRSCSASP